MGAPGRWVCLPRREGGPRGRQREVGPGARRAAFVGRSRPSARWPGRRSASQGARPPGLNAATEREPELFLSGVMRLSASVGAEMTFFRLLVPARENGLRGTLKHAGTISEAVQ